MHLLNHNYIMISIISINTILFLKLNENKPINLLNVCLEDVFKIMFFKN